MMRCIDNKMLHSVEFKSHGPLAQLVEQLTLNQRVGGSSPPRLICYQSVMAVEKPPFPFVRL